MKQFKIRLEINFPLQTPTLYFTSNLLQIFIQKLVIGTNSESDKYAENLQVLAITRLSFLVIILLFLHIITWS